MTDNPVPPPVPAGLRLVAWLAAAATFILIAIGGLLTSKEAGLSVPDWPTTYGYHMFYFPFSQWTGGIFYEHTHRLWASLVGLLTAVLAGWIWARENAGALRWIGLAAIVATLGLMGVRTQGMFIALAVVALGVALFSLTRVPGDPRPVRWWAAIAFCLVLVQGVLGGLRVTALKDELGIFHGTLAQLFFVLVTALALSTTRWWAALPEKWGAAAVAHLRPLLTAVAVLVLVQLALGASMRHQHAGLAVPDFPLAHGRLWPATDPAAVSRYNAGRKDVLEPNPITAAQIHLHMTHRLGAVAVCVAALVIFRKTRATPLAGFGGGWLALILLQAALGAGTVLTNKAADVATFHVLTGAVALVTMSLAAVCVWRVSR